jgi:hypothetical protein
VESGRCPSRNTSSDGDRDVNGHATSPVCPVSSAVFRTAFIVFDRKEPFRPPFDL